jgi:hypothetical protein
MFQLTKRPVRITSFNPRVEKNGQENVLAGDLKIECNCEARMLDVFDQQMRPFLYRALAPGEQPADLAPEAGEPLTALRLPALAPLVIGEKFPGYELQIDSGLGISEPLVLDKVTLSKFQIEPLEGGSVTITFNASFHPTDVQSGHLCNLIQSDAEITLTPPARAPQNFNATVIATGMEDEDNAVVVTELVTVHNGGTHQFEVTATLEDGDTVKAGEWAVRPTLDEIAAGIFDELECPVEFTPAVREDYERQAA